MLYCEQPTFQVAIDGTVRAFQWDSPPLVGAGPALQAAAAIISCRLTYRDGDHKVLRVGFGAKATVMAPDATTPHPFVRVYWTATLQDDSIADSPFRGPPVSVFDDGLSRALGVPPTHVDDPVVGELQVMVIAADHPDIRFTHGLHDGAGLIETPVSSPRSGPTIATAIVGASAGVQALFLAGAKVEFLGGDHHVHKVSASLAATPLGSAYRINAKTLIQDSNGDDLHRGALLYTKLELPAALYQVGEATIGQKQTGVPHARPRSSGVAVTAPSLAGIRGFATEFWGSEHHVRTLAFGLTHGWLGSGEMAQGFSGISHQDRWNEEYAGLIELTTITGPIARFADFRPFVAPTPTLVRPMGEAPVAGVLPKPGFRPSRTLPKKPR